MTDPKNTSHGQAPPPPVVCTLDPNQRESQKLEWSDISGLALTVERLATGVRATFAAHCEAQLQELADRERDCCGSWLSVAISSNDTGLVLDVTTENPDGAALIYSMLPTALD